MAWEIWVLVLNAIGFNLVWNTRLSWAQTDGFTPGAVPLAVRSPYLNCWLDTTDATRLVWPSTWNNLPLGWAGYARVDGIAYQWMGAGGNPAIISSQKITPTRTIIEAKVGPVLLNVTYLSPLEPADLVLQSLPFSYFAVDVNSLDGAPHSVQLYSDITGDLVSANKSTIVQWNTTALEGVIYHQMQRLDNDNSNEEEIDEIAEGGTVYFAMQAGLGLSWSVQGDVDSRAQFQTSGDLGNITDSSWRAIQDRTPTMALAVDLGNILSSSSSVVWALGVVHNPSIDYTAETGPQERFPLFMSRYATMDETISAFASDYPAASNRAVSLEAKVLGDASAISPQYVDLVSLSTRQVFGALDITISQDRNGHWNTSDIKVFMKDIGFSQRVNSLDTIYAALPAFLYFNSTLPGLLLDPLIQYQGFWLEKNDYAASDLGSCHRTINHREILIFFLLDSASMLLIAHAHASFSGDGSLIFKYHGLLKRFAEYLATHALLPPAFESFGVSLKPNATNVAIKGIIALRAMAGISGALGRSSDSQRYEAMASSYAAQWHDLAVTQDRVMSTYDDPESWSMTYNLFSDRLLQIKVVDDTVFQKQDAFYQTLSSTGMWAPPYGLPVDSNAPSVAQSHWTMFAAAAAVNQTTRDTLINMVHVRATYGLMYTPNPVAYDPNSGAVDVQGGMASPAQGAIFAPLVLRQIPHTSFVDRSY
ncbi:DUF1793-domain-containing protein [Pluteus cervinus]|uniref:DUF1793-domain-containing protein n=1 Tax=Pluteus cervinus TaxID=181527 RepID=A0ACD3B112_9AGAR|nr:DUF1793-domain-containing protein [Pluteus cervinus]